MCQWTAGTSSLAVLRIDSSAGLPDGVRRLRRAVEQICLSPQCGFLSTHEGNALTEEQQMAKLRLVVETAREVWG
jgi:hypothetical protein